MPQRLFLGQLAEFRCGSRSESTVTHDGVLMMCVGILQTLAATAVSFYTMYE